MEPGVWNAIELLKTDLLCHERWRPELSCDRREHDKATVVSEAQVAGPPELLES